jgi:hypothetical protein
MASEALPQAVEAVAEGCDSRRASYAGIDVSTASLPPSFDSSGHTPDFRWAPLLVRDLASPSKPNQALAWVGGVAPRRGRHTNLHYVEATSVWQFVSTPP